MKQVNGNIGGISLVRSQIPALPSLASLTEKRRQVRIMLNQARSKNATIAELNEILKVSVSNRLQDLDEGKCWTCISYVISEAIAEES